MPHEGLRAAATLVHVQGTTADYGAGHSPATVLQALNQRVGEPAYAPWALAAGGVLAFVAFFVDVVGLAVLGGTAWLYWHLRSLDSHRRAYRLLYYLDEIAQERWRSLCAALCDLTRAQQLWSVSATGATDLLSRRVARIGQSPLPGVTTGFVPYFIDFGFQTLYFLPDMVYLQSGNHHWWGLPYGTVTVSAASTVSIEGGPVPPDAEVVGSTWRHANKDGSPDRRFAQNAQLRVVRYGTILLESDGGWRARLQVSSARGAEQFVRATDGAVFRARPRSRATESPPRSSDRRARGSRARTTTAPPPRTEQATPRSASPTPGCYEALGLRPGCTRREATARYRHLARNLHPDLARNLSPELTALAELEMKRINAAWEELRRLNDW